MSYEKSTIHRAKGLARVIEQYKNKPVLEALLTMVLDQCQELEEVFYDIYTKRFLANAEGVQLDTVGALVGEDRKGRDDDLYYLWIKVRIAINRSKGTSGDIINLIKLIETSAFVLYEPGGATLIVEFQEAPVQDESVLYEVLFQGKAGGVALFLVAGDFDQGEAFVFGVEDEMVDATNGYALDDETQGGYLSTVF
jgi:hypothetical protein